MHVVLTFKGTCLFFSGGGDGVKHGDMDSSLMKPNKELDVHMGFDGKPFKPKGEFGKPAYFTLKGDMIWGKNVEPTYQWYNGSINAVTASDMIDPGAIV